MEQPIQQLPRDILRILFKKLLVKDYTTNELIQLLVLMKRSGIEITDFRRELRYIKLYKKLSSYISPNSEHDELYEKMQLGIWNISYSGYLYDPKGMHLSIFSEPEPSEESYMRTRNLLASIAINYPSFYIDGKVSFILKDFTFIKDIVYQPILDMIHEYTDLHISVQI